MHKVVSWVFKFIGISIILMLILDVSLMLFDIAITNNRIQSQASFMQMELAKNNYISDEADAVFTGSAGSQGFAYIADKSRVVSDIRYNFQDLSKDNIGQYGDFKTMIIEADFNPWGYVINPQILKDSQSGNIKYVQSSILTFTYTVPCLRYLK